jgi:UDPglucose 6-dehydrogenase
MKLGIAGYGFVGQAHELILKDYHDIIVSDPDKGHYGDLRHADAIIVCVSTPQGSHGGCKMDNVFNVLDGAPDVPVLIKSTLSVEGWKMIEHAFPQLSLTFSPEFLRAAHWREDALSTKHFYLGGNGTQFWSDILLQALGPISISIEDPADLVAAKALRNSFLALKVSFFNQVFDYAQAHGLNYEAVANVIGADERIGYSHTGVTKERGYGGHCFPKDVRAVIKSGQAYNARLTLLEEADAYNSTIRRDTSQD